MVNNAQKSDKSSNMFNDNTYDDGNYQSMRAPAVPIDGW